MTNKFIERRVEALENELSELKLIVAQIRKPSTVVEEALANDIIEFEGKQYKKVDREAREGDVVITSHDSSFVKANKPYKVARCNEIVYIEDATVHVYNVGRTLETVEVYELMDGYNPGILIVDETPIKTANQLRAEIIEKAKSFIQYYENEHWEFSVAHEFGRTIAYNLKSKVSKVGQSKCAFGDLFNEHIGKAIALGRALGLDVSEFEQAVQPNEIVLGHAISSTGKNGEYYEYPEVTKVESGKVWGVDSVRGYNSYTPIKEFYTESATRPKIINDTNAIYETAVSE